MKKNKGLYLLVGLFCLCVSGASVYAASYDAQNEVGVKFVGSTSTTSSTTTSSTSTSITTSSSSSSSNSSIQSSSSLPDTNQKGSTFLWWGNNGGGSGGMTRYYADDKLLPSTGELVHLALPFVGVFLVMLIVFYLRRSRRERV